MKRMLGKGTAHYHVVSRVVDKAFRFGVVERNRFRDMMWRIAAFSGVKVLTYTVMSNHFHLLIEVPDKRKAVISDEELIRRIRMIYGENETRHIASQLAGWRADGNERMVEFIREQYLYRMHDLSEFMKTLKQRFSVWYNRTHRRKGTLWEERFRSVLLESPEDSERERSRRTLLTVAAYIEMNAVRAGLVEDPKDYRWSGYGEAVAGNSPGRKGIGLLMGMVDSAWRTVAAAYRVYVFCKVGEDVYTREQILEVLNAGGDLSMSDLLRCRVRYFTDGMVMGSRSFVESAFESNREAFGTKRKTGARRMLGGQWGGLHTARDLKVRVIE